MRNNNYNVRVRYNNEGHNFDWTISFPEIISANMDRGKKGRPIIPVLAVRLFTVTNFLHLGGILITVMPTVACQWAGPINDVKQ